MQHPSDEDLERYVVRALAAEESARIERHLDDCGDCRELVSALMADDGVADDRVTTQREEPTAPAGPLMLQPGEVIEGKYRLIRVVGRGAMGLIYEAHHEPLNQRVALKFLEGPLAANPGVQQRFIREARAAARLHGPNICRVLELGTHAGRPFLVLELLIGEALDVRLLRGPVPWRKALEWLQGVCAGLEEAHALGVVHRDIKPANIFLAQLGGKEVVKLIDFGIARSVNPEIDHGLGQLTSTNLFVGTPAYMAPEQYQPAMGGVGPAADLWGVGAVLFELLTGQHPFEGDDALALRRAVLETHHRDVHKLAPELPRAVVQIVERCLQKDPSARYPNAAALGAALEQAERGAERRGTLPRAAALAGAAAFVVLAVGGWLWRKPLPVAPAQPTAAAHVEAHPVPQPRVEAVAPVLQAPTPAAPVLQAPTPAAPEETATLPSTEPASVAVPAAKPKPKPARPKTRSAEPPKPSELELRP